MSPFARFQLALDNFVPTKMLPEKLFFATPNFFLIPSYSLNFEKSKIFHFILNLQSEMRLFQV